MEQNITIKTLLTLLHSGVLAILSAIELSTRDGNS